MGNMFSWHMWRGLNFLETILVLLLVGFAIMLAVNLTMVAAETDPVSDHRLQVSCALQEKMEQLRAGYIDGLQSGYDTIHGFRRTWRVVDASTAP